MHYAALMSMGKAGRDVPHDPSCLLIRQRPAFRDPRLERAAGKVLEHHVRPSVLLAEIKELHDVRMGQGCRGPRFPLEAKPVGIRSKKLHDDGAVQAVVVRRPHLRHRRSAQDSLQAVTARQH